MRGLPSLSDRLKSLRAGLHAAMRKDRVALLRELGKLPSLKKPGELEVSLARLEKRLETAAARKERRRAGLPA